MNSYEQLMQNHNISLVLAAAVICVLGSGLTIRLFMRVRQRQMQSNLIQLGLTGMIGGGTIWATHFIAMLAYDPGFIHGFGPGATLGSLLIAMTGMMVSFVTAILPRFRRKAELGGAIFGLTVALMHYTGMSAYLIPGGIVWNHGLVALSLVLGVSLGALAYHRVVYPVTRFCWLGGTVAMVLAICGMHFTGMAAVSFALDPAVVVPPNPLSDITLAIIVLSAMIVVLVMGLSAFLIESRLEQETHDQLRHITLQDPLTHLPNRLSLQKRLEENDHDIQSGQLERVGVLTIDLDLFKQVNDAFGHQTGDLVLKSIANRLVAVLEPGEYVARSGGDEFVAIKTNVATPKDVAAFAERLRQQILKPIPQGAVTHRVGASIGISTCPEDGNDIYALLANSDIAMYQAKQNRSGKICVFKTGMHEANQTRIALTSDLRLALGRDEFALHYQQQNETGSHKIIGFEALLRWVHPTRGVVSPADFIPIAEETGMILDIGEWVLRTAVREAASWDLPLSIAVNVAPQQLIAPSFVEIVADVLMENGLDPARLELEITEASIIDDKQNTLDVMNQLKKMGVKIAMDDFGIGYSSLATLQTFPFDKIKIDRSFVSGVNDDRKRAAIVRATLLIGAAFNIPVLAEGVEEQEELDFLARENCREAQGYFFGKPMSRTDMRRLIAAAPHHDCVSAKAS